MIYVTKCMHALQNNLKSILFHGNDLNTSLVNKYTLNSCNRQKFSSALPRKMVSGKDFRATLRHSMPGAPKKKGPRVVPAFTIQSLQKNTVVANPPVCGAYKARPLRTTDFHKYYKRGDFPISMETDSTGNKIAWKVDIEKLDFHHYLPMFFDGLKETAFPTKFFARQGIHDMLVYGGNKIFPVIPQLIIPIKRALNTRNSEVMCTTLKVLQHLVTQVDMAGVALVPYYRQILPVMNLFKDKNVNCGDDIDYTQKKRINVGDLVNETLELFERYGGEDAFINIKYMCPTYESCMQN